MDRSIPLHSKPRFSERGFFLAFPFRQRRLPKQLYEMRLEPALVRMVESFHPPVFEKKSLAGGRPSIVLKSPFT